MENISRVRVGVMGASGYAGMQLVDLLMSHPNIELLALSAHQGAGQYLEGMHPKYGVLGYRGLLLTHQELLDGLDELDVVFLALPHGVSQTWVKALRQKGAQSKPAASPLIIDLSGDYRLPQEDYEQWYQQEHTDPEGLNQMHYGLPALFHQSAGANQISNPGCYPTAALLALAPLLAHGLVAPADLVVDAKSGVSGAGRSAAVANLYCEVNESVKVYGVGTHRHTPEIEHHLSRIAGQHCTVQFTPHLVPMQYGLLASAYGRYIENFNSPGTIGAGTQPQPETQSQPQPQPDTEALLGLYRDYYAESPVVKVIAGLPETRWAVGTPLAYVTVRSDLRTGRIMAFCAIDNTWMGAASQAIQNMNLALGWPELTGLA